MMARFCGAAVQVEVADVLVCRGIPKEEAREIVLIELGPSNAHPLYTDMRTKEL
jgi:hypothetical protein